METKAKTIEEYLSLKNTENFFDFSSGVDIAEDQMQDFIIALVKTVRKQNVTQRQAVHSGNTMIEIFYDADEQKVEILVAKNYKKAELYFVDEGIVDLGGIPLKKDLNTNRWEINYHLIWDN